MDAFHAENLMELRRDQAEMLIAVNQDRLQHGDFILRARSEMKQLLLNPVTYFINSYSGSSVDKKRKSFVLTVYSELEGRVYHLQIICESGGQDERRNSNSFYYRFEKQKHFFSSLSELVAHYQTHPFVVNSAVDYENMSCLTIRLKNAISTRLFYAVQDWYIPQLNDEMTNQ